MSVAADHGLFEKDGLCCSIAEGAGCGWFIWSLTQDLITKEAQTALTEDFHLLERVERFSLLCTVGSGAVDHGPWVPQDPVAPPGCPLYLFSPLWVCSLLLAAPSSSLFRKLLAESQSVTE